MSIPKTSICIPTYNQTKYLKRTLDSILIQSFSEYELIVSDDSSNDDVSVLINEYRLKFNDKLKYYRNIPALGAPENWNFAISKAQGTWIKIMHHDDWFCESYALEKMMRKAFQNPSALIFSGIKGFIINENRKYVNFPNNKQLELIKSTPFELIWGNIVGPPSTILFPKMNIAFDKSLIWLVDIEFYLQLLIKQKMDIVFMEEVLLENQTDTHNITNQCFQNKMIEVKEFNHIFNKYYPKAGILHRVLFVIKFKKHLSSYTKSNFWELMIANLKK
ncbi:MAG: glycosyltransferase family 2 protein [Bacteroidia bacterium]|nr:glycosyltransferase family 2 protein [Bacteroidia bacterium]